MGGSCGVMQQGYKKLRTQPGKRQSTCAGSVLASPFTYICQAAFPITDYLGKTSSVTAARSNRSRDQSYVLVGHGKLRAGRRAPRAQRRPPSHGDPKSLSQEKGAHSQAQSRPRCLLPGLGPPPRPSPELSPRCRMSKSPSSFRRKTDAPFPKTATRESAARTSLEMHVEKP